MSLQEQLEVLKAGRRRVVPEDVWAEMERHIEELGRSGQLARMPKVGDRAPTFTLPSAAGEFVSLEGLLARGPVVLSFYRGRW
jgi:hypothetical protein